MYFLRSCLAYNEGRMGEQAVECLCVVHTHMRVHAWRGQTSNSGVEESFILGFCFVSERKVFHGDLRLTDSDTSAGQVQIHELQGPVFALCSSGIISV